MTPVEIGLVLWIVAAVPAALLVGRALRAGNRDVADEAAAYLRNLGDG